MFADIAAAQSIRVLSLRYFNPIGADPKMRTGLQLSRPTHALGRMMLALEDGVADQGVEPHLAGVEHAGDHVVDLVVSQRYPHGFELVHQPDEHRALAGRVGDEEASDGRRAACFVLTPGGNGGGA